MVDYHVAPTERPLRRCIACRHQFPQRILARIVRMPDGVVCLDQARHRLDGRGAYLCWNTDCLQRAERRHLLRHVLRSEIPAGVYKVLREVISQSRGDLDDLTQTT